MCTAQYGRCTGHGDGSDSRHEKHDRLMMTVMATAICRFFERFVDVAAFEFACAFSFSWPAACAFTCSFAFMFPFKIAF